MCLVDAQPTWRHIVHVQCTTINDQKFAHCHYGQSHATFPRPDHCKCNTTYVTQTTDIVSCNWSPNNPQLDLTAHPCSTSPHPNDRLTDFSSSLDGKDRMEPINDELAKVQPNLPFCSTNIAVFFERSTHALMYHTFIDSITTLLVPAASVWHHWIWVFHYWKNPQQSTQAVGLYMDMTDKLWIHTQSMNMSFGEEIFSPHISTTSHTISALHMTNYYEYSNRSLHDDDYIAVLTGISCISTGSVASLDKNY